MFGPELDVEKVLEEFEPFTIEVESVRLIEGEESNEFSMNTAFMSFKQNEDEDIVSNMVFVTKDDGESKHVETVNTTVIKEGDVSHYYLTFECVDYTNDEVEGWIADPQLRLYQEMDANHYSYMSAHFIDYAIKNCEAYTVGNYFLPLDMLGFGLAFDDDGSLFKGLVTEVLLSTCKYEDNTYSFVATAPTDDGLITDQLVFTLSENGAIDNAIAISMADDFEEVTTKGVMYTFEELEDFTELDSIEGLTCASRGDAPDYLPIILDETSDSEFEALNTFIECVTSTLDEVLRP